MKNSVASFGWHGSDEDETSSRFLQLLLRIYRTLSKRYPAQYPAEETQAVIGSAPEEAMVRLSESLMQHTGNNTILLLIENLDAYFAKFSVEEQRRWRGFMRDNPVFTTVATANDCSMESPKQDEPFYGFFDTLHLSPLSVDETLKMLLKIADLTDDAELDRVLRTSEGRSRLKVIHFLAGGNPRLYVLLAELITEDSLDDVVRAFETMVDRQLTHYYQERLRWLSPLQQDIVHVLCRHRPAVSVKSIAQELFTSNQSISGQLKELRSFGYVRATKDGRETRYELAEPLMRLVLQVKETDSQQPLRLLVEFLQAWFERADLESRLSSGQVGDSGRKYLLAAIESYDRFHETGASATHTGPEAGAVDEESEAMSLLAEGVELGLKGEYSDAIAKFGKIISSTGTSIDLVGAALVNRGFTYDCKDAWRKAIADYSAVLELAGAPQILYRASLGQSGCRARASV